jgi:hypothetical protein
MENCPDSKLYKEYLEKDKKKILEFLNAIDVL